MVQMPLPVTTPAQRLSAPRERSVQRLSSGGRVDSHLVLGACSLDLSGENRALVDAMIRTPILLYLYALLRVSPNDIL